MVTHAPLEESEEATCQLRVPAGRACALTLSWPTSHGYSALVADIPGPGRHALAELAAREDFAQELPEAQDRVRETLRLMQALGRTWQRRPDLMTGRRLSKEETQLLALYKEQCGQSTKKGV